MSLTKVTNSMILGASVNVLDYGAKGDGVTDDALAIIAAQNSLTSGGQLYFPQGTYMIGTAIPFKRGVRYTGASSYSTILKATAASWDNIMGYAYPTTQGDVNQNQDVLIENLTFDGNKNARTENQLVLNGTVSGTFVGAETITSSSGGVSKVVVWNIAGTFVGISPNPSITTGTFLVGDTVTGATSGATMVVVSKSTDDAFQINIRADHLLKSTIKNCRIINSFFTALSLYDGCQEVTVTNNIFLNNNKSGTVLPSPYTIFMESFVYDCVIDNNYIAGSLGSGIVLRGGVCRANKISRNQIFSPPNYGIEVMSNATDVMSDNSVTDNTVYGSGADGIVIWGNTQTIYNTVVANNTLDACAEAIALRGNLIGVSVTGNAINDCTAGLIAHGISTASFRYASNTAYGGSASATSELGIGYQFPATPVLSANANTLDEYTEYTSASTACTGAITTAAIWKLTKIGNVVTLSLPSVTGTATATTSFTYGAVIPVAYRPAVNTASVSALITNNGATQTTGGLIFVDVATGIIYVARDAAYSAAFTASAIGGLGQGATISWLV
jgi:hypothetical protein